QVPLLEGAVRQLTSFPGPLGPSSSKDKLLKWLADQAAACAAEAAASLQPPPPPPAPGSDPQSQLQPQQPPSLAQQSQLLWEVLRLRVKYSDGGGGGGGLG
ncbi:hypothetical protein Agub_g13452, partial [Astrephomene gubernaculifera]